MLTSCAPEGIGQPFAIASSMVTGNTLNVTGLARRVSGFFDRNSIITGGSRPSDTLWRALLKKNVTPEMKWNIVKSGSQKNFDVISGE